MNGSLAWYSRVAWLGIAANLLLAAWGLIDTDSLLALFDLPRADPILWPQFAMLLLVLLSLFYMPAALHPQRYATIAVLTVVARVAGVVFFSIQNGPYLVFALYDAAFGLPQALLLIAAFRQGVLPGPAAQASRSSLSASTSTGWMRALLWLTVVAIVGALIAGVLAWHIVFRVEATRYDSAEEHFKYGSIATEYTGEVPYWIWMVLPRVFPEYLPRTGGYAALGSPWEPDRATPVGFSTLTIGFPRVGVNCAICLTDTYEIAATAEHRFMLI